MYKLPKIRKCGISNNDSIPAESIERTLERWMMNKQKIEGTAPIIYTERSKGVLPATNIRTDRWEVAIEATEKIAKSFKARRDENHMKVVKDDVGEPKSIQGKEENSTAS